MWPWWYRGDMGTNIDLSCSRNSDADMVLGSSLGLAVTMIPGDGKDHPDQCGHSGSCGPEHGPSRLNCIPWQQEPRISIQALANVAPRTHRWPSAAAWPGRHLGSLPPQSAPHRRHPGLRRQAGLQLPTSFHLLFFLYVSFHGAWTILFLCLSHFSAPYFLKMMGSTCLRTQAGFLLTCRGFEGPSRLDLVWADLHQAGIKTFHLNMHAFYFKYSFHAFHFSLLFW